MECLEESKFEGRVGSGLSRVSVITIIIHVAGRLASGTASHSKDTCPIRHLSVCGCTHTNKVCYWQLLTIKINGQGEPHGPSSSVVNICYFDTKR